MGLVDRNRKIPKSMIGVCILDILGDASETNPITQGKIRELLEGIYGIKTDRKTVHRHLEAIVESVSGIRYTEKQRIVDGEESSIMTDFWLDKESQFDDLELRALIYTVLFARHIPVKHKKDLVGKLEALSSSELHRKMGNVVFEDENTAGDFNELFLSMEIIEEAIEEKKKVSFKYASYEIDKKLHVSEKVFTASPLGIGVRDGDFYLLATVNGVDNDRPTDVQAHFEAVFEAMQAGEVRIDVFRMDRISGAEKLSEDREKLDSPRGLRLKGARWNRLNVQEYARENPSLSSGHAVQAKLRLREGERCTVSDAIDHFGKANARVFVEDRDSRGRPTSYVVSVKANDGAVRDFVLSNTPDVEPLKPDGLRKEIESAYRVALERMG